MRNPEIGERCHTDLDRYTPAKNEDGVLMKSRAGKLRVAYRLGSEAEIVDVGYRKNVYSRTN